MREVIQLDELFLKGRLNMEYFTLVLNIDLLRVKSDLFDRLSGSCLVKTIQCLEGEKVTFSLSRFAFLLFVFVKGSRTKTPFICDHQVHQKKFYSTVRPTSFYI